MNTRMMIFLNDGLIIGWLWHVRSGSGRADGDTSTNHDT